MTPVVAIPHGTRLLTVASNHGKPNHPSWYHNLLANPRASFVRGHATYQVTVYEAVGKERQYLWRYCLDIFPGWEVYDRRTPERHLPIMVLVPDDS